MANFQFPHFEFDESNVGERPNLVASNNRIGVVAPFTRGSRDFRTITSLEELDEVYKLDDTVGSVAIQTAMDQGARDFGVIRVMGAGVQALADITITGTRATDSNQIGVKVIDGTEVYRLPALVPVTKNTTDVPTLAALLAQAVSLAAMPVTAISNGVDRVTLSAREAGTAGDALQFQLYLAREISDAFTQVGGLTGTTADIDAAAVLFDDAAYAFAGGNVTFTADTTQFLVAKKAADAALSIKAVGQAYVLEADEMIVGDWDGTAYVPRAAGYYATAIGLSFSPALNAAAANLANGVDGPRKATRTIKVSRYIKTAFVPVARAKVTLAGTVHAADAETVTVTLTPVAGGAVKTFTYNTVPGTDTLATIATAVATAIDADASVAATAVGAEITITATAAYTMAVATERAGADVEISKDGDVSFTSGSKAVLRSGVVVFHETDLPVAETEVSLTPAGNVLVVNDAGELLAYPIGYVPVASEIVVADYTVAGGLVVRPVTPNKGDMLLVEYPSEGNDGNTASISLTYTPGSKFFDIIVRKVAVGENRNEVLRDMRIDLYNDVNGDGYFRGTLFSNMAHVKWIGTEAMTSEMPAQISEQPLLGGYDGPAITLDDYRAAIRKMGLYPVNILICPLSPAEHARYGRAIGDELIIQAETGTTENEGLRVAVLAAPPGQRSVTARDYMMTFTPASRAVTVAGWATYPKRSRLRRFSVDPVGFYAGHLAATPVQVSPAARASSPFFRGISEVDTERGSVAFENYTKAGMDAIILDPATGGFHCLNGRTMSVDPAWYWTAIRRVYNKIRMDLFQNLQWVKSEPNTPFLRMRVAAQVDNYLNTLKMQGVINGFAPTKCNDENNPPKLVKQGMLRIDIAPSFIYPSDYPSVGISRLDDPLLIPTAGA